MLTINEQSVWHRLYYLLFALVSIAILMYYLSNTIFHFTTDHQFPVNSIHRFPLTVLIFPVEIFSALFGLYFVYVLFNDRDKHSRPVGLDDTKSLGLAILLPIYNEPKEIIERTLKAIENVRWKGKIHVYLLDDSKEDSYIAEMRTIVRRLKGSQLSGNLSNFAYSHIKRESREGFKAGNLNNAIKNHVTEDYFAIFDSDQAPEPEFFEQTMDYFADQKVGFVQTPQYYLNDSSHLERAIRLGNNIFFQGQTVCKAKDGAMPFCGTNVVVRAKAFKEVNGFAYYTSTEDLDLGIRMNDLGYYGKYVPKVLVTGYGPLDFKSYTSQQYRWANGNLAVLRENWYKILFGKNFSLRYQIHTLFTLGWWFIGIVSLLFILVPIISLTTGFPTHHTWLPSWMLILLYVNVILGINIIFVSLRKRLPGEKIRFRDALLQYSLLTNSMFIYIRAAINAMLGRYIGFVRTDKVKSESGLGLIWMNLALGSICFILSIYALFNAAIAVDLQGVRTYLPVSLWLLFYSLILVSSILFIGGSDYSTKAIS